MNKTLLLLVALTFGAFLQGCGDDTTEPTKTVNKDLLTDKNWYDNNGNRAHYFHGDGSYMQAGFGTWQWFPTGDSMTITTPSLGSFTYYFDYITETEMAASTRNFNFSVYTTTP